jgi:hypothetical protein
MSTGYPQETAAGHAGSGATPVAIAVAVTGLQPGTTYHFRILAANGAGTTAGRDMTFKTAGLAPPKAALPAIITGPAASVGTHDATLTGTIDPSASAVHYYFEVGTHQLYEFQTLSQALSPSTHPTPVTASVEGLQNDETYVYRLIAVNEGGEVAAAPDESFSTALTERANPLALEATASPAFQIGMPDVVTVSGKLLTPPALRSSPLACEGFVDIAFRVHTISIQMLRAGLHSDCSFSLPVRFSNRWRLLGGHVQVHVLFPGNQLLHRLAAPVQTIQVGSSSPVAVVVR